MSKADIYDLLAVFPGLVESIDSKDWTNALKWVDVIEDCIWKATHSIE